MRLVILVGYHGGAILSDAVLDPPGDQPEYLGLAANLLAGRGFVTAQSPAAPYIFRPPGYPLVLAGLIWATGGSLGAIRTIQLMATLGFVPLGVRLFRRLVSAPLAVAGAGLAFALNPFLVYFSLTILSDSQFQLLFAGGLVALVLLRPGHTLGAIGAGVLLGLAALTRGEGWYFAWTAILIAAISRDAERRRLVALALAGFLATMAPWIGRNWVAFHAFIPTQSGPIWRTLALSHAPGYTGHPWPGYDEEVDRITAAARARPETEGERLALRRLGAFFLAHPRDFLVGTLANAGHFYALSPRESDYGNAAAKTPYQGRGYTLLSWIGYAIWLPFLPVGLYVAWQRARPTAVIFGAILVVNLSIGALLHANIRIRSENQFVILTLALIGLAEVFARLVGSTTVRSAER